MHVRDGLFLNRLPNGDVKITLRARTTPDSAILYQTTLTAHQWVAAVAGCATDPDKALTALLSVHLNKPEDSGTG